MRYVGIDYGFQRIGVALSDLGGVFAFPNQVLDVSDRARAIERIHSLVKDEGVQKIIIGLPLSAEGGETEQTRSVKEFAGELLSAVQLPVEFENEILTSKMPERQGVARDRIDAASAALILQSYLDRVNANHDLRI